MTPNDRKRVYRRELILASAIVAGGLVVTSLSLAQLATHPEFGTGHHAFPNGAGDATSAIDAGRRK